MENSAQKYVEPKPKGLVQNIFARMYIIVLAVMAGIVLKYGKGFFKYKWFLLYMVIGSVAGWTWNLFITYSSKLPGWFYHPWSVVAGNKGMVLEDWLFYPICGALFYVVRNAIPNIGVWSMTSKNITIGVLYLLMIFATSIFTIGGQSISIWFAIPGLIMLFLNRYTLNLGRFFVVGLIIVALGQQWDMITTNIIPSITGWEWSAEWSYVYVDAGGISHHSALWLDKKWSWIGNIPIEIMYWFNISGWIFIYGVGEVIDNIRYRKVS